MLRAVYAVCVPVEDNVTKRTLLSILYLGYCRYGIGASWDNTQILRSGQSFYITVTFIAALDFFFPFRAALP